MVYPSKESGIVKIPYKTGYDLFYEEKSGSLGYRKMTIKLNRENDFHADAAFRLEIRMPQKSDDAEMT